LSAPGAPPPGALKSQISTGIVKLLHAYTGRGPTKARTYIADDLVTVVFRDTMTPGEQKLVAAGEGDAVLSLRHKYQMAMKDDSIALIEELTGRRVTAFMSANHIAPDAAAEIYMLEPDPSADTPEG
jgi:uncharacterized protein YbcI